MNFSLSATKTFLVTHFLLFGFGKYYTILCSAAPSSSHTTGSNSTYSASMVNKQEYIVKFKDHTRFEAANMRLQSDPNLVMSLPEDDAEVMILSNEEDLQYWQEQEDVEYVEPNYEMFLHAESTPYGINAVKALSVSDARVSNQKVCIVDSGYDINHPDLPSSRNIVTGTSHVGGTWSTDEIGHGTHVAGTIAAIGGNDQGVVGVIRNGQVRLHISRVFAGGTTPLATVIEGVRACAAAGSTVVNMSLGGSGFSRTFNDLVTSMTNRGILMVAAAGNGGSSALNYPASYSSVVSVAAVDRNNNHAYFSQFNREVDLSAPGVGVVSTTPGGRYSSYRGTSMAAPHVAGVAALVWSHFPNKSPQEIRQALESTAVDLGPSGRDDRFGHGLVRADLAYNFLKGTGPVPTPTPPSPTPPTTGGGFSRKFVLINPHTGKALDAYYARCDDGTNIHLWDRNDTGAQIFHYHYATNAIVNVMCNKALTVSSCTNGANVYLSTRNGGSNQQMQFYTDQTIRLRNCGKAIDIYQKYTSRRTNIWLYDVNNEWDKKWRYVYV